MKKYERFDSCYGVVDCSCKSGTWLTLDNQEPAFTGGSGLNPGTRVLCTVSRSAAENRHGDVRVRIDSVYYDDYYAA